MTAFCAVSDVQDLMPKLVFSETSKPNLVQVGGYIAMIDAQLRAALQAAGYAPASLDPAALPLVTGWCAAGAADLTEQAAFPSADVGRTHRAMFQAGLDMIKKQALPGPGLSVGAVPLARSAENLNAAQPVFDRGVKQW